MISTRPIAAIEYVLSGAAAIFGLYLMSPWYEIEKSIGHGTVFDDFGMIIVLGVFFILVAGYMLYGLIKSSEEIRSQGLFYLFLSLTFISILRILNFGFVPLIWFFPMVCAIITAVCYIKIKLEDAVWTQR